MKKKYDFRRKSTWNGYSQGFWLRKEIFSENVQIIGQNPCEYPLQAK